MRLDKFLKVSRMIKQRQRAKELCDSGAVSVNGVAAKPSYEIKAGDTLEVISGEVKLKTEVREVPRGNVSKADAATLIDIVERTALDGFR